ncbi:MAG: glutamate-1-semialdehyde 2,1-aminomutase [Phycisphaerae bacterium]|nr:glutamate-1-semialdehyde 2,1-aminomutase [Phycisphaerae bacterium]
MSRRTGKSQAAFERAQAVLVGGVNSPVRAFAAVGGQPAVIAEARGAYVTDLDGNRYIDYVGGYGPAILGHAHPAVVQAITEAVGRGTCPGAPTEAETHLAELICAAFPSVTKLRMTSSGTEAVMSAVRLARGATGRRRIVKCIGCYHGHADALLVSAGSGAAALAAASSAGVPPAAVADTLVVPYNDLGAMERAFDQFAGEIAAVLVEPVAANMGVVPPAAGYLAGLRGLCDRHGALLIFDEVITGFRIARGGAQELYGVRADITAFGKIIGGGLPAGAFGASGEIMAHLAPEGPVYQAGTLSGNPAVTAAGLATLKALQADGFYHRLEQTSGDLERGLRQAAAAAGLEGQVCLNRVGSLLCCFFAPPPVVDFATASAGDAGAFAAYFQAMLEAGIFLAPSPFEAMFVSAAHARAEVQRTVEAAAGAFQRAGRLMESSGRCR